MGLITGIVEKKQQMEPCNEYFNCILIVIPLDYLIILKHVPLKHAALFRNLRPERYKASKKF